MRSHAKLAGHAIHQQLIVFPLGLLGTAVIFDLIRLATGDARYATAAFLMLAAGIVGGLVAAPFGLVDYLAVPPGTRAKRVGLLHGAGNVVVLALFAVSWALRLGPTDHVPTAAALWLALAAVTLSVVTGWLGGELVSRLGVGVDPEAGLDTPATLETHVHLGHDTSRPPAAANDATTRATMTR